MIASVFDTEHVTIVETISGDGCTIDPLIIIKGSIIQARWFADIRNAPNLAITVTESGYSNDVVSFLWLQHFDRLTRDRQQGRCRLLIVDGYDSHLTYEFVRYCEMAKIILLQLPPHTTHFLQPLDVVIFQQWKHWHAEQLDYCVRRGAGQFNRQTFLASIEAIRAHTFKEYNIRSAFRNTGFIPYRPQLVLRKLDSSNQNSHQNQIADCGETLSGEESAGDSPRLPTLWRTPTRLPDIRQQGDEILNAMRSSVTPPDTPTRHQNRENVRAYIRGFNSQAHLHKLMVDHLWECEVSKQAEKARTERTRSQVSKGGIAYASDVHRFIAASSNPPDLERVLGGISDDQKVFYLIMKNYVHPALLMCTKERYKKAQQSAINLEKRLARRRARHDREEHEEEEVRDAEPSDASQLTSQQAETTSERRRKRRKNIQGNREYRDI